ncbi:helix-turn-helix domain-containing protein [Pontibacillus yanchengensis]|uniref:helix-turn-helix domain-containing protein n=1 Tax=Pontibacillus yanchengensis TaxID=462910 RepID=UPI002351382D|nr:helix-turn-helix domain-containing protein [Pontibacillus yanchengensis]
MRALERQWLKDIREAKNMTQKDVANQCYIDRSYYTQIETGNRNPSRYVAINIAKVLNFDPSVFFTEELSSPFQLALQNVPIVIAHSDLDLKYTWIFNRHDDFIDIDAIGKKDTDLANNEGIDKLTALKQRVIDSGISGQCIIKFPLSEGWFNYLVFASPLIDSLGQVTGVATSSINLTNLEPLGVNVIEKT